MGSFSVADFLLVSIIKSLLVIHNLDILYPD